MAKKRDRERKQHRMHVQAEPSSGFPPVETKRGGEYVTVQCSNDGCSVGIVLAAARRDQRGRAQDLRLEGRKIRCPICKTDYCGGAIIYGA